MTTQVHAALAPDDPRHGLVRGYYAGCRRGSCPLPPYEDCTQAHSVDHYRRRHGEILPRVSAVGCQRRLQALVAMGWPASELSFRLGYSNRGQVAHLLRRTWLEHATSVAVCRVYDELSMTPGPSTRARAQAARNGWPPPLAWDDDTIDDPEMRPAHDLKPTRKKGDPKANRAVHVADVEILAGAGLTREVIAARLGVQVGALQTGLEREGRRDLWVRLCLREDVEIRSAA